MNSSASYLPKLHSIMSQRFDMNELEDLCFKLGIDPENLNGGTKNAKIRSLIMLMARHKTLDDLIGMLQWERPEQDWPYPPADFKLPDSYLQDNGSPQSINITSSSGTLTNIGGQQAFNAPVNIDQSTSISTDGGANINDSTIRTGGGDFVGRDHYVEHVYGDKIEEKVVVSGSVRGNVIFNRAMPQYDIPPKEPTSLPDVQMLLGRDSDIAFYNDQLNSTGLAIFSGIAGVGKTMLAATIARQNFADSAIFWHTFLPSHGLLNILRKISEFLAFRYQQDNLWKHLNLGLQPGFNLRPESELVEELLSGLTGRRLLLCFDDFHLVGNKEDITVFFDSLLEFQQNNHVKIMIITRRVPDFVSSTAALRTIEGLSLQATGQLFEMRGVWIDLSLVEKIHQYTDGNTALLLLTIDLILHGAEPETLVNELIQERDVTRFFAHKIRKNLTQDLRHVMEAVSVLQGYPGSAAAIYATLGNLPVNNEILELNDRLLLSERRSGSNREYVQQTIIRDYFYSQLEPVKKMRMHIRAADHFKGRTNDLFLAANHYYWGESFNTAADLATQQLLHHINRGYGRKLNELLGRFSKESINPELWFAVQLGRGRIFTHYGEPDNAKQKLETALSIATHLPDDQLANVSLAKGYRYMGELMIMQDPEDAIGWFDKGVETAMQSEKNAELLGAIWINKGTALMYNGRYQEARDSFLAGLELLPQHPSQLKITALENLGVVAVEFEQQLDKGLDLSNQALALSHEVGDTFKVAEITSTIGSYKFITDQWTEAQADFEHAHQTAIELGNRRLQAMTSSNLGGLYTYIGHWWKAHALFETAEQLAQVTGQPRGQLSVLLSKSRVEILLGQWEAAQTSIDAAQKLIEELQAGFLQPILWRLTAELYLHTGRLDQAAKQIDQIITQSSEHSDPAEFGIVLTIQGSIAAAADNASAAQQAFEAALDLLAKTDSYENAKCQLQYGILLQSQGDSEQALSLFHSAKQTFTQLGAQHDLAKVDQLINELT